MHQAHDKLMAPRWQQNAKKTQTVSENQTPVLRLTLKHSEASRFFKQANFLRPV
jgi:hypothetical protein